MQSNSEDLKLRCNPDFHTLGAGEGPTQSHHTVHGHSSLEYHVIVIQMIPPRVVQYMQHAPAEGIKSTALTTATTNK